MMDDSIRQRMAILAGIPASSIKKSLNEAKEPPIDPETKKPLLTDEEEEVTEGQKPDEEGIGVRKIQKKDEDETEESEEEEETTTEGLESDPGSDQPGVSESPPPPNTATAKAEDAAAMAEAAQVKTPGYPNEGRESTSDYGVHETQETDSTAKTAAEKTMINVKELDPPKGDFVVPQASETAFTEDQTLKEWRQKTLFDLLKSKFIK